MDFNFFLKSRTTIKLLEIQFETDKPLDQFDFDSNQNYINIYLKNCH